MSDLVQCDWLAARLDDPAVRVLDASWHMPSSGRDAAAEFREAHIPGAVRFDHDAASEPGATLAHALASPEHFAWGATALGLTSQHTIVVYDTGGVSSAARAWWLFGTFGHRDVRVLDGGLPAWRAEGRPLERGAVRSPDAATSYVAHLDRTRVRSRDEVRAASLSGRAIADARPPARFRGEAPEPRPDLRRGHIPGSRNVPSTALVDPTTGRLRSRDDLRAHFEANGIDPAGPVICTCGSGVTACVLALALDELGNRDVAVYDGSWADWATQVDPKELTAP